MRARVSTAGSLRGPAVLVVALAVLVSSCTRPQVQAASAPVLMTGAGVGGLQQRLRAVPGDWHAWAALGFSYVQQARRSGDPTYYPKAERALQRSLRLDRPTNFEAMTGLATLAAARHDFAGAL